jgi:hypothetical protein
MPTKIDAPLTRKEAINYARILGGINLALGAYMILGGLAEIADISLPGATAKMIGGVLGLIVLVVAWGSAAASGLGLLMLAEWGRKLAILWGRIIVWVLPISFGLSHALPEFISINFGFIIVICLYGNVVAQNLAKPDFDIAFD